MGLAVNEGKTKYLLSTSREVQRIDSQITADNYTFDTVKEFIYLGSAVTTKNDVSVEIKRSEKLGRNPDWRVVMANYVCKGIA